VSTNPPEILNLPLSLPLSTKFGHGRVVGEMASEAHVSLIFFALDKQRVDINVCLLKANTSDGSGG
jgi:hypothetical protein